MPTQRAMTTITPTTAPAAIPAVDPDLEPVESLEAPVEEVEAGFPEAVAVTVDPAKTVVAMTDGDDVAPLLEDPVDELDPISVVTVPVFVIPNVHAFCPPHFADGQARQLMLQFWS